MTSRNCIAAAAIAALLVTTAEAQVVNPANGHTYVLTTTPSTYLAARATATAMGGYIVAINDAAEQAWVTANVSTGFNVWIGLTDEVQEGVFVWDSGEAVTYNNWCAGEPNNAGDEDFVNLSAFAITPNCWNDSTSTILFRAVVEIGAIVQAPATAQIGTTIPYLLRTTSPYEIYWFDVSLTGSSPGVPIGGGFVIPLNEPWLNFALGATYPGFVNFVGVTDATATAAASVVLPPAPFLVGATLTASFVVIDLSVPTYVVAVAPARNTLIQAEPPVVGGIAPVAGPAVGGTTVSISGSGFQAGVTVKFGATNATVASVMPNQINCTSPLGVAGAVVGVTVSNPDGQSFTLPSSFTYVPNLVFASVAPTVAPPGTTVTLNGAGFQPGMTVTVAGSPVTLTSQSATTATFSAPAGTPCDSTVVLATPYGQSASKPFNPSPAIAGTLFPSGTHTGGMTFVMTGSNFVSGTTVTVGGAAATVTTVTPTAIVCITPPGTVGPASVVVTSPTGCTATTTYTYL